MLQRLLAFGQGIPDRATGRWFTCCLAATKDEPSLLLVHRSKAIDMVDPSETGLDKINRHIATAEALIARQVALIAELRRDGHPEAAARGDDLLATLHKTLEMMRKSSGRSA